MRVIITVDCDNAAFEPDGALELSRILDHLADYVKTIEPAEWPCTIQDMNGNTCGKLEVKRPRKSA